MTRQPTAAMLTVTTLLVVQSVSGRPAAAADTPVATPPAPSTPADNQVAHAKRDADQTANDANEAAGDGSADQRANRITRDANAATAADVGHITDAKGTPDAVAIRKVLAEVAVAAVFPDHMDRLTQRLAQPDRDRIRTGPAYGQGSGPALDDAAKQFDGLWSQKYGHPFNATAAAAALAGSFATVRQIVPEQTNDQMPTNLGDATPMARVTVAASHGLPELDVPTVREMPDGWKVDVPDTVDADVLRKNLTDQIGAASSAKDQWPTDEAEAYRAVTHRVLLALMGQPLPQTK